jgi:anti-sigma factor RsiW
MTCREVIDFLSQYLEGELTPEQRAAFERHLALCDDCVEYLSNYRQTVELGKAASSQPPPANALPPDLVQAVLKSLREQTPPPAE